jgi:hypothetical protein
MYGTYNSLYNPRVLFPQSMNDIVRQPVVSTIADPYESNPKTWGPHYWKMLSTTAANYPIRADVDTQNCMVNFLRGLFLTIPCASCSNHYKGYIEKNKDRLDEICSSRNNLFNFITDLHNMVNGRTGKPQFSYEQARKLYKVTDY